MEASPRAGPIAVAKRRWLCPGRVLITWGLLDLFERISHQTCPTIDVQHGVFMHELVDRNELKASLGLNPKHKVVVPIGRIAVEKNVQALVDADVKHLMAE